MIILSVGFITLLERKILSLFNCRLGPLKVLIWGVVHFINDAFKIILKEWANLYIINNLMYYFVPFLMLMVSFLVWVVFPLYKFLFLIFINSVLFILLLGLKSFILLVIGWSVNSVYSSIRVIRIIIQVVSYEVRFILVILLFLMIIAEFNLIWFIFYQYYIRFIFFRVGVYLIYYLRFLCEVCRLPFDFFEGESELVSGFNIEYNSLYFMYIYMVEYIDIFFICYFVVILFFNIDVLNIIFYLFILINLFLVIWIRGTYVRFRYDKIIILMWLYFLPILINYLILVSWLYY